MNREEFVSRFDFHPLVCCTVDVVLGSDAGADAHKDQPYGEGGQQQT